MNIVELLQIAAELHDKCHPLYKERILAPAFSGFLSISGFIFAMHSFVVTKMKEGVYDSEEYKAKLQIAANKHMKAVPLYTNLKSLHHQLMLCVYVCLVTALTQLLLGYFSWLWLLPASLCIVSILILLRTVTTMRSNMKYLFDALDLISIQPQAKDG